MSYLKSVKEVFQKEFAGKKDEFYDYKKIQSDRLIGYRKEKQAIVKLEKPTNLPRARELGYKAKQGITVVRVRIRKGAGLKRRPSRARRPKRMAVSKLTRRKSIQAIAETRASKKYRNLEVLGSYWIGEDGKHKYFEVILLDPQHPVIKSDKELNWICERGQKGRAERGLTPAGKKSRGLKRRRSAEKVRPSRRAHDRKA